MFEGAKRYVTRKIKNIEFLNTSFPQDYEAINVEYRRLRNELDNFSNVLDKLGNYEFGGSVMKNVSKLSKRLTSTSKMSFMRTDDIYTEAALVGEELAKGAHSSTIKGTGTKFAAAYQTVADAKRKMNLNLKEIMGSLKILKEDAKMIDGLRRDSEDIRYDLEEKIQENAASKLEIDSITGHFNSKSLEALRGMKAFMGDAGVSGLLKRTAQIHKEFSEVSTKALLSVD